MKDKSHTCDTWYVPLHSPCNFRLSGMHSGKIYTNLANVKRHMRKSTPVEVPKSYICPVPSMQTAGFSSHSAPFESIPSEYLSTASHQMSVHVCSVETGSMPTPIGDMEVLSLFGLHVHSLKYERLLMAYCVVEHLPLCQCSELWDLE
jgi:hypothetical protein